MVSLYVWGYLDEQGAYLHHIHRGIVYSHRPTDRPPSLPSDLFVCCFESYTYQSQSRNLFGGSAPLHPSISPHPPISRRLGLVSCACVYATLLSTPRRLGQPAVAILRLSSIKAKTNQIKHQQPSLHPSSPAPRLPFLREAVDLAEHPLEGGLALLPVLPQLAEPDLLGHDRLELVLRVVLLRDHRD